MYEQLLAGFDAVADQAMLRTVSHLILVAMSSAVVVPYAITILSHLMYSHQPLRQAAARSLHPRRVYAFSLVLLQKMVLYLRYSPLYLRWRYYYINADPAILIKVRRNKSKETL